MDWLQTHLTILYGIAIGVLIIAGAVLVSDKFSATPDRSSATWGTYGGTGALIPSKVFSGSPRTPIPLEESFSITDLYKNLESSPDRLYVSLPLDSGTQTAKQTDSVTTPEETAIEALLAALKPKSYGKDFDPSAKVVDLYAAYHYIPRDILGTSTLTQKQKTPAQIAAYNYGNDAGSPIESYMSLWGRTQSQIHKGFIEDRSNPEKIGALKALGDALSFVAESLSGVDPVPTALKTPHTRLADAYRMVGEYTRALASAQSDDELLVAIENYNGAADEFLRAYLSVAGVLSFYELTYRSDEPGRVFVFTPTL